MKIGMDGMAISQKVGRMDSSPKNQNLSNKEKERDIKLRQTSKDLEAIFITQMFKAMEKTVPKSSLMGSKNTLASMMFSSVMGQALANQGGVGLADVIYRSLKEKETLPSLEEVKSNPLLDNVQDFRLLNDSEGE